jgi:translation elongation factor P/translation initiation factor 5A
MAKEECELILKLDLFNYNQKIYDQIKVEIEDIKEAQKIFEEGNEYIIEAEVFTKNNQLKIPLL